MKHNRDINSVWQADLPVWRRRLARPLRWLVLLFVLALSAGLLWLANESAAVWRIVLWFVAGLLAAGVLVVTAKAQSSHRSWRQDDSVFEPSPGKFISPLYEDRDWSMLSHPFIRYPLALLLIGYLYWVLIIHQMKLPGHFLVVLVLLFLVCLWSWREPMLLVLMMIAGVALLTLLGWVARLPLLVILVTVLVLGLGSGLSVLVLRKRKSRGRNT